MSIWGNLAGIPDSASELAPISEFWNWDRRLNSAATRLDKGALVSPEFSCLQLFWSLLAFLISSLSAGIVSKLRGSPQPNFLRKEQWQQRCGGLGAPSSLPLPCCWGGGGGGGAACCGGGGGGGGLWVWGGGRLGHLIAQEMDVCSRETACQ